MAYYGTFMSRDRHCALRVAANKDVTRFVTLYEREGELVVDVRKLSTKDFEKEYCKELIDYPVRKAAEHFLHPLTTSIHVTETAKKLLEKIMTDEAPFSTKDEVQEARQEAAITPRKAKKKPTKTRAERNVEATKKASIRTDSEVAPAPVTKDTSTGKKEQKGTWDVKPNATEENRDAQRVAVRKHREAKVVAAKKAARAAKKAAKKAAQPAKRKESTEVTTTNQENTMSATAKKTTKKTAAKKTTKKAATKKTAPAKKAATKKAPAKKLARGTGKGGGKKAAAAERKPRGRPSKVKFDEKQKIKLLVDKNPRREGTGPYEIFEMLKKSATVGAFYKKGGKAANLQRNIDKGFISVG